MTQKSAAAHPKMLGQTAMASNTPEGPVQLQADVYQLVLPQGAVSGNEAFWKRVDEQAVDVATYDLLYKNGVRVGVAPIAEWDRFRELIAEHPATTKANTLIGADAKVIELPVRKEVRAQTIWYFDARNDSIGRTYDECENFVTMTLQSAPRKAGTMRVALCPVVKSARKRLEFTSLNRELGELQYVAPERLYDMNLRVDVPPDQFLIVAPSSEAAWPTSIGNTFFITNGPAERMEHVLLIVPRTIKMVAGGK